jgi:hypothetical protein
MAILTNYEGSNDDYENNGTVGYHAQAFKIPSNASVESIAIFGSRGAAASGTFALEIYSGATPAGTLVKTETFTTTAVLSAYGSAAWNTITFATPVNLTAGVQYYAILRPLTGSTNDEYRWQTDTTSPTYADGKAWGWFAGVWTQETTRCKNFRINGTVSGAKSGLIPFFLAS